MGVRSRFSAATHSAPAGRANTGEAMFSASMAASPQTAARPRHPAGNCCLRGKHAGSSRLRPFSYACCGAMLSAIRHAAIGATLVLSLSSPANAEGPQDTVQGLLSSCTSSLDFAQGFCFGYIAAVAQRMEWEWVVNHPHFDPELTRRVVRECVDITGGAERQAFINWARAHPEYWSKFPFAGVRAALLATWPCLR